MVSVLVLTHGRLADELVAAACTIDEHLRGRIAALSLPWDVDFDEAREMLARCLETMGDEGGVLVLTDMFGGTATNVALPSLEPGRLEVVTGVNLPMLVKLATLRDRDIGVRELAERLVQAGQRSIHVASEFLRSGPRGGDR